MIGRVRINKGVKIKRIIIPDKQPKDVIAKALCPSPLNNNLCPGRIERNVSSFGAPK